ncbi:hypothetical protein Anapl_17936 [Anas platyrhynchos]|uniref:Uncharacterized protein n=1 Tax=Anas platyrhynchos TaxID=8839 RepID=R0K402_ANAPL|nr:hypothetical protein Anapl_17936 [Anas platyrhynchos]
MSKWKKYPFALGERFLMMMSKKMSKWKKYPFALGERFLLLEMPKVVKSWEQASGVPCVTFSSIFQASPVVAFCQTVLCGRDFTSLKAVAEQYRQPLEPACGNHVLVSSCSSTALKPRLQGVRGPKYWAVWQKLLMLSEPHSATFPRRAVENVTEQKGRSRLTAASLAAVCVVLVSSEALRQYDCHQFDLDICMVLEVKHPTSIGILISSYTQLIFNNTVIRRADLSSGSGGNETYLIRCQLSTGCFGACQACSKRCMVVTCSPVLPAAEGGREPALVSVLLWPRSRPFAKVGTPLSRGCGTALILPSAQLACPVARGKSPSSQSLLNFLQGWLHQIEIDDKAHFEVIKGMSNQSTATRTNLLRTTKRHMENQV